MENIRVLVVEDHPMFRDGLRALLGSMPGTEVVGEAGDGRSAVQLALELQPDVVVMDLDLPEVGGIDATREIVATSPHIAVLVLTMFDDDDSIFAAMKAGARGYLLKGEDHEKIRVAILAVYNGGAIFGPQLARRLIDYLSTPRPGIPREVFPGLTDRELEVLELVARGLPNAHIASTLGISPKTVRNHVSNIFNKLQVADRAQAIVRARDAGLGRDSRTTGGATRPPDDRAGGSSS